jgi:hypothetical protein
MRTYILVHTHTHARAYKHTHTHTHTADTAQSFCPYLLPYNPMFHENPSVGLIISTVQEHTIRSGLRLSHTVRLQGSNISRNSENYDCISDLRQTHFLRTFLCSVCLHWQLGLRLVGPPHLFSPWAQKFIQIFRRQLRKIICHLTRNKRYLIVPDKNIMMIFGLSVSVHQFSDIIYIHFQG